MAHLRTVRDNSHPRPHPGPRYDMTAKTLLALQGPATEYPGNMIFQQHDIYEEAVR